MVEQSSNPDQNTYKWKYWSKDLLRRNLLSSITFTEQGGTVKVVVRDHELGQFLIGELTREKVHIVKPVILKPLTSGIQHIPVKAFTRTEHIEETKPYKQKYQIDQSAWEKLSDHRATVAISYAAIQLATTDLVLLQNTDLRREYEQTYESYLRFIKGHSA